MADILNDTLQEIAKNVTTKPKATTEGTLIAYFSLVTMALIPIFIGAFRSVKRVEQQKDSDEKPETMTNRDAALFPVIASCALLGIYVFFKLFSKEYINLLMTVYFFGLGVVAVTHIIGPLVRNFIPEKYLALHELSYTQTVKDIKEEVFLISCGTEDIVAGAMCTAFGSIYLYNKHWVLNNMFGLAFALNGVELLHLNNIVIGCILLGGLFVYDIFWVFATDVMVTVAKSFEVPIKLVFPQDLLENWLHSSNFAMLGLGDIVIPGIFIAFLLRFDLSLKRGQKFYFYTSFIAYFLGLILTIFIMARFNHAQPALLYIVPSCIGTPLLLAVIKGDIKALFKYEDHPSDETETELDTDAQKLSSSIKNKKKN